MFLVQPLTASAAPFSWCGALDLVPRVPSDFEPIVKKIEALDDCTLKRDGQTQDEAVARCAALSATTTGEPVWISLTRSPGFGISILFSTFDMHDLGALRPCKGSPYRDGRRFEPASIVVRDQLVTDEGQTALTLIDGGPATAAHIFSSAGFNAEQISRAYQAVLLHGLPKKTVSTKIRLEGLDPLATPAPVLVARFVQAGGRVTRTEDQGTREPRWCLAGGSELKGAGSICVQAMIDHVWTVTYRVAGRSDFARAVKGLKASLGKQLSDSANGCNIHWWQSGDMLVRASYCRRDAGNITFISNVASAQRDALDARIGDPD